MTGALYVYALLVFLAFIGLVIQSTGDSYQYGLNHGKNPSIVKGLMNTIFWLSFSLSNFYIIFSQQLGWMKIPLMILLIVTMLIYVKFFYTNKKSLS